MKGLLQRFWVTKPSSHLSPNFWPCSSKSPKKNSWTNPWSSLWKRRIRRPWRNSWSTCTWANRPWIGQWDPKSPNYVRSWRSISSSRRTIWSRRHRIRKRRQLLPSPEDSLPQYHPPPKHPKKTSWRKRPRIEKTEIKLDKVEKTNEGKKYMEEKEDKKLMKNPLFGSDTPVSSRRSSTTNEKQPQKKPGPKMGPKSSKKRARDDDDEASSSKKLKTTP